MKTEKDLVSGILAEFANTRASLEVRIKTEGATLPKYVLSQLQLLLDVYTIAIDAIESELYNDKAIKTAKENIEKTIDNIKIEESLNPSASQTSNVSPVEDADGTDFYNAF